ncbi:MAG: helix-turn-helix transcriptional regulator [Pseudomonadales bacterium]
MTKNNAALNIDHDLGQVVVKPAGRVNRVRLKKMIRATLDEYLEQAQIPASDVHKATRSRHGSNYQTPGYYLRLYRQRADLTQAALADAVESRQHHLSEMEHNKRTVGKAMAKKLAQVLDCDYRRLL